MTLDMVMEDVTELYVFLVPINGIRAFSDCFDALAPIVYLFLL